MVTKTSMTLAVLLLFALAGVTNGRRRAGQGFFLANNLTHIFIPGDGYYYVLVSLRDKKAERTWLKDDERRDFYTKTASYSCDWDGNLKPKGDLSGYRVWKPKGRP